MEQYQELHKHCKNALSESSEKEMPKNIRLESVHRSKAKTALMISNIDRAMEELEKEYKRKDMAYKYEAFRAHYIKGMSYEEIADKQNCGKNTPSRWIKELLQQMSVKLFGIDGVEMW